MSCRVQESAAHGAGGHFNERKQERRVGKRSYPNLRIQTMQEEGRSGVLDREGENTLTSRVLRPSPFR